MFSSTGTRSDSGSGRVEAPHLEADRALLLLVAVMEIDAERPLLVQALDGADIAGGNGGRIGLLEAGGEGVAVALEQGLRLVGRIDLRQRFAQPVAPGAHDCRRPPLPAWRGRSPARRRQSGR